MTERLQPYPAMRDSGVECLGKVPNHWEVRRLGRLGSLLKGNGGSKDDEVEHGIPCIRYGDLYTTYQNFIEESRSFISEESARRYTSVRFGDVLFAASGETIPEIGKSAVNLISSNARCGGDIILFRPLREFDTRFLGYLLDCRPISDQKAVMGRGITVMHIYGVQLKYLSLPLPPRSEQAAIVRFLDHVDRRIQRYIRAKEKLIALLEEERRVRVKNIVQSASVTESRLENVADLIYRPVIRKNSEQYTAIGIYNRGRGFFLKEPRSGEDLGDSDFFWIEEGDLVISGQFAWEGSIALASHAESGCIASHRYPIVRGKRGVLETDFLLAFFQTDWGQLLLDHHSRGAAGRNRPLNAKSLMKEEISFPSLEVQHQVSSMLKREAVVRTQVREWIQVLNEYRTRLIADVVTGKVDVRSAAAELPELEPITDGGRLDAIQDEANFPIAEGSIAQEASR